MIFKSFDRTDYFTKLTFQNEVHFKTIFGGILTLCLGIITILCIIGFGLDLVKKNKSSVVMADFIDPLPRLEREEFEFAISFMIKGGVPIENFERMFNVLTTYGITDNDSEEITSWTTKSMVKCSSIDGFNSSERYKKMSSEFISYPETYFCLPPNFDTPLEYSFGSPKFTTLEIVVQYCQNTTDYNKCMTREEIQQSGYEFFYTQLVYKTNYIDSSDFQNPVKEIFDAKLFRIAINSFRTDFPVFKGLEYSSDNGILLDSTQTYNGFYLYPDMNLI